MYITGEGTICYNYLIIDTVSFGVRILQKENIIYRWKEPEKVTAYFSSGIFIQLSKDITPRVLFTVSLIWVPVFLVLSNLAPEEMFRPIARRLIWIFPVAILLCLLYFVQGLLGRFFETKYTIGEKKIVKTGFNNSKVICWKNVTGYSLGKDEQFPDAISITVYSRRIKTVLWLPKSELSSQVIETFNERCPLITEVEADQSSRTIPSDSAYFHFLILSLLYSIGVSYLVFSYRSPHLFLLVSMVLGPGTLGCLFFYGWRSFKEKVIRVYAVGFNLFAFFLSSLCWILLCLYHWSKIIKELSGK